jgi:hypothetical protein
MTELIIKWPKMPTYITSTKSIVKSKLCLFKIAPKVPKKKIKLNKNNKFEILYIYISESNNTKGSFLKNIKKK